MFIPKVTFPLALSAALIAGPLAQAQTTTTVQSVPGSTTTETTTTTTAGLVSEIAPDGLIVRTESSVAPIRYWSSAATVYVDETGRPVAREMVTSGLPVTVHYTRVGERLLADRVIVRRQTSTTTEGPTVIERNTTITRPPQVVEKKVYVDRPVVVEKKVPVVVEKKVYVDRPVIVEKPVVVERPAPAPIIERKTTTTTTTSGKKEKD